MTLRCIGLNRRRTPQRDAILSLGVSDSERRQELRQQLVPHGEQRNDQQNKNYK